MRGDLVLAGLRQMEQQEIREMDTNCAAAIRQAQTALEPLYARLTADLGQTIQSAYLTRDDVASENAEVAQVRLSRQAAAIAQETLQASARDLQVELSKLLAREMNRLYAFFTAVDLIVSHLQPATVGPSSTPPAVPANPTNAAPPASLRDSFKVAWDQYRASAPDRPDTNLAAGLLTAVLGAPALAQALLACRVPPPPDAQAQALIDSFCDAVRREAEQYWQSNRAAVERALEGHVTLMYNRLKFALDRALDERLRTLEDAAEHGH